MFPTSPTPKPSTKTFPFGTDVVSVASFSFNYNVLPFDIMKIFLGSIPSFLAVSA